MIVDSYNAKLASNEEIDEELKSLVDLVPKASSKSATSSTGATTSKFGINRSSIYNKSSLLGNNQSSKESIDPEQSGKMIVLFRMMQTMRALKNGERIVVVSNYTQTLDLIQQLCEQNNWPALRLDGTISSTKRTKIVDEFNNPMSNAFAFLLSSKAGGCGINLIGGNRLVLYGK